MKETRKCVVCGKTYIAIRYNSKYCSDSCYDTGLREKERIRDREKRKKEEAERQKKADNRKSISDYTAAARAAGLSYGQYVAQMRMQRMARRA